jgi:hypothetical protein
MSMQAEAIGYASWLSATGEQVKQAARAARQASAAAAAYEAAFGATVPPALVTENRAVLTSLVATNIFGQNTTRSTICASNSPTWRWSAMCSCVPWPCGPGDRSKSDGLGRGVHDKNVDLGST